jgi:hypothetical protein
MRWHRFFWRRRQAAQPRALARFASKTYSQFGEDGMLAEVFHRLGEGNRYAVELGVGEGSECCTRNLLVNHGWNGLLMEADPTLAARAAARFGGLGGVRVVCQTVTVENVLDLFAAHEVPTAPDLLVIDIDGNDYWVWQRLLPSYRPRVVVIEYNGRWVPPQEWIMPYRPNHRWDGSVHQGASLASLVQLASGHRYSLVACSPEGVNAFFIRNDCLGDHFPDHAMGLRYHYAAPRYGRGFGHPVRAITRS